MLVFQDVSFCSSHCACCLLLGCLAWSSLCGLGWALTHRGLHHPRLSQSLPISSRAGSDATNPLPVWMGVTCCGLVMYAALYALASSFSGKTPGIVPWGLLLHGNFILMETLPLGRRKRLTRVRKQKKPRRLKTFGNLGVSQSSLTKTVQMLNST